MCKYKGQLLLLLVSTYAKEHSNELFASIGEQFVIFFFNAIDFLSICENLSVGLAIKSNKLNAMMYEYSHFLSMNLYFLFLKKD